MADKPYCYEYPRPAVTVDTVAFTLRDARLHVLLIQRKGEPVAGAWALPGGFLDLDEPVETGARRELKEETGIEPTWPLEPLGFFGAPGRDPRGRTISLVYATVFAPPAPDPTGADDARDAAWQPVEALPQLAFDHADILRLALRWLGDRVRNGAVGLAMLPAEFTERDVKALFAALFGSPQDAASWRTRLAKKRVIEPLDTRPVRWRLIEGVLGKRPD